MRESINVHFQGGNFLDLLAITKIGAWDWDLSTNTVVYSKEWAELLGYTVEELPQNVTSWEKHVLLEDLPYANAQIERHLRGKVPLYEAEFRMVRKDGQIIWAQDKGRVVAFDENGNPKQFIGVLQDVTRLKSAETELSTSRQTLDLSVNVASLGTWNWDLLKNTIAYNDEYLNMLGYTQEDISGSIEEWEEMNHPEDLPNTVAKLNAYIEGRSSSYECEIRMKKKDGRYVWTRDVGRIVEWDNNNRPTRIIGGHLNIDSFKQIQSDLESALSELEGHRVLLESEVEKRTRALTEQDKMLWHVNDIAKKLLTFDEGHQFEEMVYDCLQMLGEATGQNRVYIWKDVIVEGEPCCTQVYEWVRNAKPIQNMEEFANLPYEMLPSLCRMIFKGRCLNSFVRDLSETEQEILGGQGIHAILVAPISIQGKNWGFIGIDNCENSELFSDLEENLLLMSGFMLANAIQKNESQDLLREMEERNLLMLNAMPLCCNLWTKEFVNMACNDEAVRLFGLRTQEEYLDRFFELMPEYQPNGQRSSDMAKTVLEKAFEEGYCRFEFLHQKPNGDPIPSEVTLVRIRYKGGYIVAGYTRDLRELKAMLAEMHKVEANLRLAHEEAMLSSKAKSNFLANMSHEIRTPMNAISGLAELLLRDSGNRETAERAAGIKQAAQSLLSIINDILDISKIESGKLEIQESEYQMGSLLNDTISISRLRLGNKPLLFVADIDSRLPGVLFGDEIRIKQILINILSNAIKFTQEGSIVLRADYSMEENRVELVFSVQDTGSGISQEDLSRLFQEFERVNTTKNRSIEGTGLGLAITKRLCEMMGGSIQVQSTLGMGSTFTVRIPQDCHQYRPLATVQRRNSVLLYEAREPYRRSIQKTLQTMGCQCTSCQNQSELLDQLYLQPYDYIIAPSLHIKKVKRLMKKELLKASLIMLSEYGESWNEPDVYTVFLPLYCLPLADIFNHEATGGVPSTRNSSQLGAFVAPDARVLVVDDNPVNLQVAIGLMEPYRFSIDTAVNGLEAVERVRENQYDLVFMDHMMPEMDGIDATIAIRKLSGEYFEKLPIVALTANAIVGTKEMFLREGMNDFLAKPIEMGKLSAVLSRWLPQEKQQRVEEAEKPMPVEAVEEQPQLIIEGVNTAQGITMVGGNLQNYLQILSTYYSDGLQKSGTLLKHLGNGNILLFKTEVHALKSTSATIGAHAISDQARRMEEEAARLNTAYLEENINEFVLELSALLENIRPHVKDTHSKLSTTKRDENLPVGSAQTLEKSLSRLQEHLDFVQIAEIESVLGELEGFGWEANIAKELVTVREAVSVFDYDAAQEAVNRLIALNQ